MLFSVIFTVNIFAEADFGRDDASYGIEGVSGDGRIFGNALRVRIRRIENPSAGGIAIFGGNGRKLPGAVLFPFVLGVFGIGKRKVVQNLALRLRPVHILKGQLKQITGPLPVRCHVG